MVPLSGIRGSASHPRGGRPREKAHAVLVVFVSFSATGARVRPAKAARPNAKAAKFRLMTCLFKNERGSSMAELQVNHDEKGLAAAFLSAI
jgi:hypothetical protein